MKNFIQQTIKEAGYIAKGFYKEDIEHTIKCDDPTDVVTKADIEVEKFLIEKILSKYPDHGIISEESDSINIDAEYVWVIDPIDGTRNYARHIAVWCVMVGITKNGKPYMGAVYDAINDELFFAEVGCGAELNGNKIKVSDHKDIKDCFISYTGGVKNKNSPYDAGNFAGYVKFYDNLRADHGHWTHNFGSTMSMCFLAAGRVDAVVMNSGLYHDYLANYVIATEAGAKFTDSDGNDWKAGRKDVVVANPVLHKKLLTLF